MREPGALPNPQRKRKLARSGTTERASTTIERKTESRLSCSRNIAGDSAASSTRQCHMRARRRREVIGRAFDRPTARRAREGLAGAIARDEMKGLCRIVGSRPWLSHGTSCTGTIDARWRERRDALEGNRQTPQDQRTLGLAKEKRFRIRWIPSTSSRCDRHSRRRSQPPAPADRQQSGLSIERAWMRKCCTKCRAFGSTFPRT